MVRLFKLFALFPLGALRGMGSLLGLVVLAFSSRTRRMVAANIAQAQKGAIGRGLELPSNLAWHAALRSGWLVTELPAIWCRPDRWKDLVIDGGDQMSELLSRQKGLIVLTPHLGAFELAPRLIARHHPLSIMYRPARHASMEVLLQAFRPSQKIQMVPARASGIRHFLRTLKSGGVVGLLPDQVPVDGEGVWAPFFDSPAYTMTLPLRLAQKTGAPLAWVVVHRVRSGWAMSVRHWALPFELDALQSPEDWAMAAHCMNREIEQLILGAPEDYLWTYNRYRRPRPELVEPAEAAAE